MSMLVTFSFKIKITQCYHYFKHNSYEQTYHSYNLLYVECSFFLVWKIQFCHLLLAANYVTSTSNFDDSLNIYLRDFLVQFWLDVFLSALKLTVILAPTVKDRSTWIHIKPMSQTSFFSLPVVILSFLISTKCGRQSIE